MPAVLKESLDLLLPPLMPTLVSSNAARKLQGIADHLAPIVRGGFECRLCHGAPQVDLQQCIIRDQDEIAVLQRFVEQLLASPGGSASLEWSRLQNFVSAWQAQLEAIPEIWLEFDIHQTCHSLPLPAIFFGLPQDISPAVATQAIAEQALDLLLGPAGWRQWQAALTRCFTACPDGVFISHIGVMLSRNTPALRVNVKRLEPQSLKPYLQQIHWPGDHQAVGTLMQQMAVVSDRITVCLDVGEHIYPHMGLECIILQQPEQDKQWAKMFDTLVSQDLCTIEKRTALLNWPGQTHPLQGGTSWPEQFILESLLQSPDDFTVFERDLSHIKLSYKPQGLLEAKAYLWFQHQWLSRRLRES